MRSLVTLALGLIAALSTGAPSFAADKVVFQLGWLPTGDIAAAYVGVDKGFFADEGLDVTIQTGRGSLDAVSRIATGASDMGALGLGAVLQAAAAGPVPVKVVMSQYSKMPDAVMTWKGSGITSIKQVAGRTVGTAPLAVITVFWPVVLSANGIDPTSLKMVKTDPNALPGLLATGQVDATLNWAATGPGLAKTLKQVGKELVVLPWTDIGFEGYGSVLLASDRTIRERPDVVTRMVRAYRRLLAAAVRDPSLVGAAVKASVPAVDEATTTAEFQACVPLIKNEISDRDGLGALNPQLVKITWEWLAKAQDYPLDKLDPETLMNRSFLGPL